MEQIWDKDISHICEVCGLSKGSKTTKNDCICGKKKKEPSPVEKAIQARIVKESQIESLQLQLEKLQNDEKPVEVVTVNDVKKTILKEKISDGTIGIEMNGTPVTNNVYIEVKKFRIEDGFTKFNLKIKIRN